MIWRERTEVRNGMENSRQNGSPKFDFLLIYLWSQEMTSDDWMGHCVGPIWAVKIKKQLKERCCCVGRPYHLWSFAYLILQFKSKTIHSEFMTQFWPRFDHRNPLGGSECSQLSHRIGPSARSIRFSLDFMFQFKKRKTGAMTSYLTEI
jgi:hypothetical protein